MKRKFLIGICASLVLACQPELSSTPSLQPLPSLSVTSSPSVSALPSASSTPSQQPMPSPTPFVENPKIETVAGGSNFGFKDGIAIEATFNDIRGLCHDPRNSDLYILDTHKIRKLSPEGVVTTLSGQENEGVKDGALAEALFSQLRDCVVDQLGTVYVTDNNGIRKLTPEGQVVTLTQLSPRSLAISPEGKIYFVDQLMNYLGIINKGEAKILNQYQLSLYKGNLSPKKFYQDGPIQTQATFGQIGDIAFAPNGDLYIIDSCVTV